jgi:predicted PurR-regulated permease PerM
MAAGITTTDIESGRGSPMATLIAVAAAVTALYLGRTIAIPIAIAVLISFSLGPAVNRLRLTGLGRLPSIAIVVTPALVALGAFAYVVTTEVGRLADNLPSYQSNIEAKIDSLQKSLPSRDLLDRGTAFLRGIGTNTRPAAQPSPAPRISRPHGGQSADSQPIPVEIRNPEPSPVDLLRAILGPLVEPVADAGLVLLFVVFFLAEKETLRDRLIRLAGVRDLNRTTMAMDEAGRRVSRYLLTQTLVNSVFGTVIATGLFVLGLPNAALWGGIAAALRFIPYLGVAAAAVLPLSLAFAVDPGWSMLLWTGGIFLALELVVGNLVEPWLYGPSTGLSSVALIVSLIFWTWLWGVIGLLLATPLTVCIAVMGRYVPQLAFLDVLLGNDAPLKPEESFYQRLLAGDPAEAARLGQEFLKTGSLAEFFAQVAMPALLLAERDRLRGELEGEHLRQVAQGVATVVDDLVPDDESEADGAPGEERTDAAAKIAFCIAGRSELDQAAALLLARLLTEENQRAMVVPHDSAFRRPHSEIDPSRIAAVCLSYLDPGAVPSARYLARRVRRHFGSKSCIVVGFWGIEPDSDRTDYIRTETRADRVVSSVPAALQVMRAALARGGAASHEESPLHDLALEVSHAIEQSAGLTGRL